MTVQRPASMLVDMHETTDHAANPGADADGGAHRPARVLFACVPQTGHVRPLLPLAQAFVAAGAEVLMASGPDVADAVAACGLRLHVAGPEIGAWFARLAERTPGRPGDGLTPDRVERYFIPRLFGEVGLAAMLPGLDEAVRTFAPDMLVFEPFALAAPIAGATYGVLTVQHTIGLPWEPLVSDLVDDAVTPAWRAAGLAAPRAAGRLQGPIIDVCPPGLSGRAVEPDGPRYLPLRPVPAPEPDAPLPIDLPQPGRPLVYVTLGTFANSDIDLFRAILGALAELPVNVLVTAGTDAAAAAVGEPPPNAVVAGFVPQAAILPHCAAVVHHAGAGTAFGVLAHGLPSVALPQSADNFRIAARLAATGSARVLMPGETGGVRDAVGDVLSQPVYRQAAATLAAEIAEMPTAEALVATLLAEAAQHRRDRLHPTEEALS